MVDAFLKKVPGYLLLLAMGGCTGQLGSPGEEQNCETVAEPRRVLRLGARELIQATSSVAPFEQGEVPAQLRQLARRERSDSKLVVTKELHQAVDGLARTLAEKLSTWPDQCSGFGSEDSCTSTVLSQLEIRLLRSAQDAEAHTSLIELVRGVAQRSGPIVAWTTAVRAVALSPKSLYLTEGMVGTDGELTGQETDLRGRELANFLSFRLLGRPASEELVQALGSSSLEEEKLEEILETQFGDAGVGELTQSFLESWLRVREISLLSRPADKQPGVDDAFLAALEQETRENLQSLSSAPVLELRDLLTAPHRSALLGDREGPGERPGVFALPGVIAASSSNTHTNIPRRGRFLLKSLLCQELPNPPPGAVGETPPLREGASERERFEGVASKTRCRGCHVVLDPLAYPFEVYDEVGRARVTDEHGNSIDTSGAHETQAGAKFEYTDINELMAQLADDPTVQSCVVRRVSEHILRRNIDSSANSCASSAAPANGAKSLDLLKASRAVLVRSAAASRGEVKK